MAMLPVVLPVRGWPPQRPVLLHLLHCQASLVTMRKRRKRKLVLTLRVIVLRRFHTATVEEINVKTALQGLGASNEKDEQVDGEASGDSKAQSFPSDKVSPDDLSFTNKDNVPASIGSANLDASTAKDCSNVGERSIIKQVQPSEEVIAMEECQGGHSCGKLFCKHTEE